MPPVYLDHNATTPLDPRVRDAMLPWLAGAQGAFGNPSSVHGFGQVAREAVERARAAVADLLGGRPSEIIFTSSGTEANNAVMFDIARRCEHRGHLLLSAIEHPSIRESANRLEAAGMEVTRVSPGPDGVVAASAMLGALRPDTQLVCLMLANNELGTLQPVAEVAARCREVGVPVLCDAVQAVGKIAVRVQELGVDYLTLGGHKFYGPLGAAALWVRSGLELDSLLVGGPQERRRRASTENVPAIVGLGRAAEITMEELEARTAQLCALRDRFEQGLENLPEAIVHCAAAPRVPGDALLIRLDLRGFAVSTGSACSSGAVEASKTLLAMGMPEAEARSSIRVSFGISNTAEEVEAFLEALAAESAELRRFSSALIL
jgi:cysteine desulfurase